MKNVKFLDRELKKEFEMLINLYPGLPSVVSNDKTVTSKVVRIEGTYNKIITVLRNYDVYTVTIYPREKELRIKKLFDDYSVIYNINAGARSKPIAFLYENNLMVRTIRQSNFKYNESDNEINLIINEFINHFKITLNDKESSLDDYINKLLHLECELNTISILFKKITELFDINKVDIKIEDDKDNIIETNNGQIIKYSEKVNKDGEEKRIYLKNGQFFIEKLVSEEYNDDMTSYVKSLGVINGKEKR